MRLALLFGAALLAAGTALHAQTGDRAAKKQQPSAADLQAKAAKTCEAIKRKAPADPMKGDPGRTEAAYRDCMQREMCARAKDKAACNARVAKGLETEDKARRACAGSKGKEPAYGECMRRARCAGAGDPARCETRARALENCAVLKDKGSDAYRDCMRRETCTQAADPARCQENAKAREACKSKKGDELRACIREQRGKKK